MKNETKAKKTKVLSFRLPTETRNALYTDPKWALGLKRLIKNIVVQLRAGEKVTAPVKILDEETVGFRIPLEWYNTLEKHGFDWTAVLKHEAESKIKPKK
jgi:hypothetical protein